MKKQLLLSALLLLAFNLVRANVFTVSNNLAHPTAYTDIQSAVNAASAGDSVYVIGSLTQYAGVGISKQINLFGPGFYPQKNNVLTATVNGITLNAGSDGTLISGMVITSGVYFASNASISNITVERNNLFGSGFGFGGNDIVTNFKVINNVMVNGGTFLSPSNTVFNNFLVENNVIANENSPMINGGFTSNTTLFKNNVIMTNVSGGNGTYPLTGQVEQVTFTNNIFVGWLISNGTNGVQFCTFDHNLAYLESGTYSSDPFTGGGSNNTSLSNIYNENPDFVNAPLSNPLYNSDFHLLAGSPSLTAASDGGATGRLWR